MIPSIIFGFGYRARSGKDTAAAEIVKQRGRHLIGGKFAMGVPDGDMGRGTGFDPGAYDVRIYSFGAELKAEVNQVAFEAGGMLSLFDNLHLYGAPLKNGGYLPLPEWVEFDRDAPKDDPLCPLGKQRTLLQFWGTEYRRNIDPDYWVNKLRARLEEEQPEIALITDVRFHNEVAFVKEYGEVIKVNRPGLPPATHASETTLDSMQPQDWSAILTNDGTLEDFKGKAVMLFDHLMNKVEV